jgi:hypothetical protein
MLLGRRLYRDRSLSSCRPSCAGGWLVPGLRPAVENAACEVTQKRYEREHGPKSAYPSRTPMQWQRDPTGTEVRARVMKVLLGIDPHKASVAVAVVDEAVGELVECATFLHNLEKA